MFGKITPAHLLLHLIVLIWGWSPILGRAIESEALQLVWFRIAITVLALAIYFSVIRQNLKASLKDASWLVAIGGVIAFHWFCFYNAIKVSNVSVTLVGFSTGTIFTSIIEPVLYKRRVIPYEIVFGLVIFAAIGMIMYEDIVSSHSHTGGNYNFSLGIFYGVIAAFTSSLFTVLNGIMVRRVSSSVITLYELGGGLLFLSLYLVLTGAFADEYKFADGSMHGFFDLPQNDYYFLAILAIVGTAFPFIASTNLLRKLSPYTITLTVNLETVYGIILAAVLFKEYEQLTTLFYISTSIILLTILMNAWFKNYLESKKKSADK